MRLPPGPATPQEAAGRPAAEDHPLPAGPEQEGAREVRPVL